MIPNESPWGKITDCTQVTSEVWWVSTQTGGGLMIEQDEAEYILSPAARKFGMQWKSWFCFEEYHAVAIPIYEHPEWSLPFVCLEALEDIQKYFPSYFEDPERQPDEIRPKPEVDLTLDDLYALVGYASVARKSPVDADIAGRLSRQLLSVWEYWSKRVNPSDTGSLTFRLHLVNQESEK